MATKQGCWTLAIAYLTWTTVLQHSAYAGDLHRRQVLAPRKLFQYQAYKDVQLFHYTVPEQVVTGIWEFQANHSLNCDEPLQVIVYLKHGSYPVLRMESVQESPNLATPRNLILELKLRPEDQKPISLNVSSPLPGDWFAAAFYVPSNPQQQNSAFQCNVWLSSTATFDVDSNVIPLVSGFPLEQHLSRTQRYRFFSGDNSWSARISLTGCDPCPVRLSLEHRVIPICDAMAHCIDCRSTDCMLDTPIAEDDWNYIQVEPLGPTVVNFSILVHIFTCSNDGNEETKLGILMPLPMPSKAPSVPQSLILETCFPRLSLIRQKLPGNFAFRYSQITEEFLSTPVVNVSTVHPTLAIFRVMPIVDIGGTFTVKVNLSMTQSATHNTGMSFSACLQFNERPRFTSSGDCVTGFGMHLNMSTPDSNHGEILVPFPEAGIWYFLMQPSCYVKPIGKHGSVTPTPCKMNTTTLILQLESGPCSLDQCGQYGRCYQYLRGGLLFSSCHCIAGRKGWHCTDDSEAYSYTQVLTALLLLTVSNVFYLPVIILSIHRRHFTEALVYVSAMVFSTLYHACDFEVSSYCVIRLSVLQYCDVFSCVMAIWLTMIARSDLPNSVRSMCHMVGALTLALCVEYNRAGFWVFVLPAVAGTIIACISFMVQCYYQRCCFPLKQATWIQITVGMAFMTAGILLLTVFEDSSNYDYVHSARHVCFALSALFLLPGRRSSKSMQDGINTCSYIRVEELSDISHPLECGVYQHLLTPTP